MSLSTYQLTFRKEHTHSAEYMMKKIFFFLFDVVVRLQSSSSLII